MQTLEFKQIQTQPKPLMSRAAILDATRRYMALEDYKPLSIDIALQNVRWLVNTYQLTPENITRARGEDIKIDMKRRQLKPNTIRQRLYAYEYLAAGLGIKNIDGSPVCIKKPPRGKPNRIYLSISEAREALDAADNYRDRAIMALLLYCGLRSGELSRLTPESVDLKSRMVHVVDRKNGENIDVPMTKECSRAVEEWLRYRPASRQPYLFMSARDNQLGRESVDHIVKSVIRRAGIDKKMSPHKLRHTAASSALKMGVPFSEVQLMLGHLDAESTLTYLHGDVEGLKESVDKKFHY